MKMTVFHVFFLVLVMWAVHSHGRAYETESIIYNNTQLPYKENMNAATVINSKLKHFDYFYLVFRWPKSFCTRGTVSCWPQIPDRFTVHGLWPQHTSGGLIDCKGAKNTAPFNFPKLEHYEDGHLVHKLNDFWPNLIINKPNYNYWKQEFEKHGSCFFPTQEQYFESTTWMVDQIPDLTRKLESQGICPGTSHLFKDLQQKIIKATGFIPRLECYQSTTDRSNQLYQIYFCADKSKFLYNCSDSKLTPNNIKCGQKNRATPTYPSNSMATIFSPSALFSSTTTTPTKPPQTPPSTKPHLPIPPSNSKSPLTTTLTTTLTATVLATTILTSSPPSLADTPTYQLYYGTAASAANYGGYGGNSSKKDSAEYIYEVPDGWKERLVSKVEKGTNGTDSEFYNPKKKSEREYLTFLSGFRQLAPKDAVLNNLALSDVDLQDLIASANSVTSEERKDENGQVYYVYEIDGVGAHGLISVTCANNKLYAHFVNAPTPEWSKDKDMLRHVHESFKTVGSF